MADQIGSRSAQETKLLERAKQRLPGGVLGTSRYADDVGFVVKHGKGSKIYDVSGREYIDYVMASGPMVLGHAHPAVVAAVPRRCAGRDELTERQKQVLLEIYESFRREATAAHAGGRRGGRRRGGSGRHPGGRG